MGFLRARLLHVSLFDFLTPNPKSKHGITERAKERVHSVMKFISKHSKWLCRLHFYIFWGFNHHRPWWGCVHFDI